MAQEVTVSGNIEAAAHINTNGDARRTAGRRSRCSLVDEPVQGQLGETCHQLGHPIADPADGVSGLQIRRHGVEVRVGPRHHPVVRDAGEPERLVGEGGVVDRRGTVSGVLAGHVPTPYQLPVIPLINRCPRMVLAASSPLMVAASMQPALSPQLVQSPASTRWS